MNRLGIQDIHSHAHSYRDRIILMARASLGGKQNEDIVRHEIPNIRHLALEALEVSRHLKVDKHLPMPFRKAILVLRSEAVLICGMTRKQQMAADGTIPFQPKEARMEYNLSILKHYERMLDSITCLRDISPKECAQ